MNNSSFSSYDVIELYSATNQLQIQIWLDGGWGVDALLGEQTRAHKDLDIVIQEKDLEKFCTFLAMRGYKDIPQDDSCDWNFVLGDNHGHKMDIHVVNFDAQGNGIYGPAERGIFYPADAFSGRGQIEKETVCCLTPEYQVLSRSGYELTEKDFEDVFALCSRFNITLPNEYQRDKTNK
jgi:lincosamide nucleotidyltransferase A/C/D/E